MRGNEFLEKMELIDPAYMEAADTAPQVKKQNWLKKCGTIAACFVLMIALSFGTYAYAAEAKEYNDAMRFFQEYDLSTEGLTRSEIKKVYRDITTKSFSYHKTADVILDSLSSDQIGGHEILQEDPTPEDLENLWNERYYNGKHWVTDPEGVPEIRYSYDVEFKDGGLYKVYLEKYDKDTLVWRVYITDGPISHLFPVSDGVIACWLCPDEGNVNAWFTKIGESGNRLWTRMLDNGFKNECFATVLENPDGSYAVITYGNNGYLCLTQYTSWGMKIHSQKTEIGLCQIQMVKPFGDGYAVLLSDSVKEETPNILIMDHAGNVTSSFAHSSEDSYYCITDMMDFNGKLYLSGHTVPKASDENSDEPRNDYYSILEYAQGLSPWMQYSEELTTMIRDAHTAILMVCDPSTGILQNFYSVKGSCGGTLYLTTDGTLMWEVESITSTCYSSSHGFFGSCYVFQYVFDQNGDLIGQKKTDTVTHFEW